MPAASMSQPDTTAQEPQPTAAQSRSRRSRRAGPCRGGHGVGVPEPKRPGVKVSTRTPDRPWPFRTGRCQRRRNGRRS